jgi:hypothetical protein
MIRFKTNEGVVSIPLISRRDVEAVEENIPSLSQSGWTIPMTLTFSELRELPIVTNNINKDIDTWFLQYYLNEENKNFHSLIDIIIKSSSFAEWMPLIEECYQAFNHGQRLIIIPSLITIIEGALSKKLGIIKSKQVQMIHPTKAMQDKPHPSDLHKLAWQSLASVVEMLYTKSDFTSKKPKYINRHWILHGRDTNCSQWDEVDCLKLFNFLGTLTSV